MELVGILRVLGAHRRLVALMAVLGCLAAAAVTLTSHRYTVGIGSVTALVDTPQSQVVDLGGPTTGGSIATLAARASLLASLMTSSPIKDEIAAKSGIAPDHLIGVQPASPVAGGSAPATVPASTFSPTSPQANILKAAVPNLGSGDNPIIAVATQAPNAAFAARLANESIAVLQEHLQTVAGIDRVPAPRRVVVTQLGAARSATVTRGPSPVTGVLVGVLVFLLGCGSIVGISALVGSWRHAAVLERFTPDEWELAHEPAVRGFERDGDGPDGDSDEAPTADVIGMSGARRK